MLQTIDFHYSIISHFREQYLKIYPKIQKLHEAEYPARFNYISTAFLPAFEENVTCTIQTDYHNARVQFQSPRLYKGNAEQLVLISTHEGTTTNSNISTYNGYHLSTKMYSPEMTYFSKMNEPTKNFDLLPNNDPDDLEAMEFMLMTKYDMCDLTAILLNQVLINEETELQRYVVCIPPFVGLSTDREKALLDLYFSTVIGLEHEASKAG